MTSRRQASAIDTIADAYFDELCALYPSISLFLGTENSHGFDDYSQSLRAHCLARMDFARSVNPVNERRARDSLELGELPLRPWSGSK